MKRDAIVVRLPTDLRKSIDRWTKESRKRMGPNWSRNDQIVWILRNYQPPPE